MSYNPYVCNFAFEVARAKKMSIDGLNHSIQDAMECIANDINPNKYYDQISVYRQELERRQNKKRA